jgi:hypothetical protein
MHHLQETCKQQARKKGRHNQNSEG